MRDDGIEVEHEIAVAGVSHDHSRQAIRRGRRGTAALVIPHVLGDRAWKDAPSAHQFAGDVPFVRTGMNA
jgi:hypothetical protein